jgi:hypothetical protein
MVDREKVDAAGKAFADDPRQSTAAMYLSVLHEAEEEGTIDDDRFHNGIAEIEAYLWKGGTVVPDVPR